MTTNVQAVRVYDVQIPVRSPSGTLAHLPGALALPAAARGLVLFAHGSGSSRHSPRNRSVATVLNEGGNGTLLFDLLTEGEATDRRNVFDIELLANRLLGAVEVVQRDPLTAKLPIGLFGASTGAAAALMAAAREPQVQAVVSRGGRPDLAGNRLQDVEAATLMIVGGEDRDVLDLNREALRRLDCVKQLTVVPRATHLFEEPGTLDEVARLASEWFNRHLHCPQNSPSAESPASPAALRGTR